MDNHNAVMSGCVEMAPQLREQCAPSSLALINKFQFQFSNKTSTMDNRNVLVSGYAGMAPQLGELYIPLSLALINKFHFSV